MRKLISLLLCTTVILSTASVFAEPDIVTATPPATEAPTESAVYETPSPVPETTIDPELVQNKVTVTATIGYMPFVKESDAVLELFTTDGKSLGTQSMHITSDTKELVFTFNVPVYEIGTDFKLKAISGLDSILYYEDKYHIGKELILPTYTYTAEDGSRVNSTDIAVTITPLYDKSINLYYNGTTVPLNGARVIDGTAMVPIKALAEFIGFNVRYDKDYNVEVVSLNGKDMYFNVGTTYTTIFGTDLFAPYPTTMIDDTVYVALRTFSDAIASELEVKDYLTHLDINISESSFVAEYFHSLPVNKWGISSRTNYMVWVSLSEYKVRLYEGRQYQWKPILEAPCAIGAPGTPTVTGSFEYNYKTRWDYGTYYVGPCLVFYRGYALHSVLLYQNGTEYDGRVGVKISHGCIRLKKKDIDFIANTIPVGTRIYITP